MYDFEMQTMIEFAQERDRQIQGIADGDRLRKAFRTDQWQSVRDELWLSLLFYLYTKISVKYGGLKAEVWDYMISEVPKVFDEFCRNNEPDLLSYVNRRMRTLARRYANSLGAVAKPEKNDGKRPVGLDTMIRSKNAFGGCGTIDVERDRFDIPREDEEPDEMETILANFTRHEQAYLLEEIGFSKSLIAAWFGVDKRTINRWRKGHDHDELIDRAIGAGLTKVA